MDDVPWIKRRKRPTPEEPKSPMIFSKRQKIYEDPTKNSIIKEIEAVGGKVIYGDTDSVMFEFPYLSLEKIIKLSENIVSKTQQRPVFPIKGKPMAKGKVEPLNMRQIGVIEPLEELLKYEKISDLINISLQFQNKKDMEEFSKEYNIRRTFGGYYIASIPLKDIPKLKDDLRVRRIYYTKMWLH